MTWRLHVNLHVGGENGQRGKNTLIQANGNHIDLGGKKGISVNSWVSVVSLLSHTHFY